VSKFIDIAGVFINALK